jgi:hypothetical protein
VPTLPVVEDFAAAEVMGTLRVPINHPHSSGRMLVLVKGSAESIASADLRVADLRWNADRLG